MVHRIPGIPIGALAVYNSEWKETVGQFLVYSVSEQLGAHFHAHR